MSLSFSYVIKIGKPVDKRRNAFAGCIRETVSPITIYCVDCEGEYFTPEKNKKSGKIEYKCKKYNAKALSCGYLSEELLEQEELTERSELALPRIQLPPKFPRV